MEYLDHQDWNQIIVTKKNTSNKDPDKSKKKLSESQQKDIKLLKQDLVSCLFRCKPIQWI